MKYIHLKGKPELILTIQIQRLSDFTCVAYIFQFFFICLVFSHLFLALLIHFRWILILTQSGNNQFYETFFFVIFFFHSYKWLKYKYLMCKQTAGREKTNEILFHKVMRAKRCFWDSFICVEKMSKDLLYSALR